MSLLYSRNTPYGFIDAASAQPEDLFYGEEVTLSSKAEEKRVLAIAEKLRATWASCEVIQTAGFDSQSQATEMAEVLTNV